MNKSEKEVILKSVISGYCCHNYLFTSIDITNTLKRLGVWMRNRDVAEYLRGNIDDSYQAKLIIVDCEGFTTQTFCYYPLGISTDNYMSRDQTIITPSQFEELHGFYPIPINEQI